MLAEFFPGYFALVMATSIVSLACYRAGFGGVSKVLLWFDVTAYTTLWIITLARLIFFRAEFIYDLTHHSRGATFLTMVAATCTLGCEIAVLMPWMRAAKSLWYLGLVLWLVLSYTFLTAITIREPKPSLEAGINGAWLLVIVATESISVLGALIAPMAKAPEIILFISLAMYLIGAMLYVFFATLILYRWIFFSMKPEKFTPDYWIDMGALAITTLAGAHLILVSAQWDFLASLVPFLRGITLLSWATGSWWIPLLLLVELWRHAAGHVRFVYSPDYWSLVFPLGMYSTATFLLARATDLHFLDPIAQMFAYIALAAWCFTFFGLLHRLTQLILKIKGV
jgi:tellurite resistance protein TehA-like permease